mmetsp:Transcript_5676/g.16043  ORF Transcript_5676/g.16043 Transcript_5676/m.16043 type:complete len:235 (+) Transcript_5676:1751-2455(+)
MPPMLERDGIHGQRARVAFRVLANVEETACFEALAVEDVSEGGRLQWDQSGLPLETLQGQRVLLRGVEQGADAVEVQPELSPPSVVLHTPVVGVHDDLAPEEDGAERLGKVHRGGHRRQVGEPGMQFHDAAGRLDGADARGLHGADDGEEHRRRGFAEEDEAAEIPARQLLRQHAVRAQPRITLRARFQQRFESDVLSLGIQANLGVVVQLEGLTEGQFCLLRQDGRRHHGLLR